MPNRGSIQPWLLDFLVSLTDSPSLPEQIRVGFDQALPAECRAKNHYGAMAWGPQVIKDQVCIEPLKNKENSLVGLDMESYGVALAASMRSTHAHTIAPLIVKGVSDSADSGKSDLWHDHCSCASASFVLAVLEQIFRRDHAFARLKRVSDGA